MNQETIEKMTFAKKKIDHIIRMLNTSINDKNREKMLKAIKSLANASRRLERLLV